MRGWLARRLRGIAHRLDGREFVRMSWHKIRVETTNRYIAQTENYIIALEEALGSERTTVLRAKHPPRFDTKPLRDAGAWKKWKERTKEK